MQYTKESIVEGIYAKIDSTNVSDGCKRIWKRKFVNYPIEVEQNVLEWINGFPISDIDCYGESIRKVLDYGNKDDEWFPVVLEGFISFKDSCFMSHDRVWNIYKVADVK